MCGGIARNAAGNGAVVFPNRNPLSHLSHQPNRSRIFGIYALIIAV